MLRRLILVAGDIAEIGLRPSPTTSTRRSTRPRAEVFEVADRTRRRHLPRRSAS